MNANQLRQRAQHLRDLAGSIESLPVMRLESHATDDTWHGPRPMLCRSMLGKNQQQLHVAADDLRSHAHLFEQRAAQLDAIAAARIGLAG